MRFGDQILEISGRPVVVLPAVALLAATFGLSQTASAQVSDRFNARVNKEVTVDVGTVGEPGTAGYRAGLPDDVEDRVHRLAGVDSAGVLVSDESRAVALRAGSPTELTTVFGVSAALIDTVGADVQWASDGYERVGRREALIGDLLAAQLGLPPVEARPAILLEGTPFTVVGLIDEVDRTPTMLSGIITTRADAEAVAGAATLSVLINTTSGAARQVASQVPLAIDPVEPSRLRVEAPPDPQSLRAEIEGDVRASMFAVSAVAFVASIIGIANTASSSVAQRTGEIGLRRALGARARHILGQVILEAAITGVVGGIAGLYVGTMGMLGVAIANGWSPVLDPWLIPISVLAGAAAGIVGGLAAALRAGRIQPIEALRR